MTQHTVRVKTVYRKLLKSYFSWFHFNRPAYLVRVRELRGEFEKYRNVTDVSTIETLLKKTEQFEEQYRHPEMYKSTLIEMVMDVCIELYHFQWLFMTPPSQALLTPFCFALCSYLLPFLQQLLHNLVVVCSSATCPTLSRTSPQLERLYQARQTSDRRPSCSCFFVTSSPTNHFSLCNTELRTILSRCHGYTIACIIYFADYYYSNLPQYK